ncbi:MAG: response regulator transcription factor [Parasporobacterium sp.]|nr:response regulator transcription factor [Parasporobacterium sp.]MBR3642018.1 response regulator transcription factor [Parasporobacterium sp.]
MGKLIYAADDEENIREILKSFLMDSGFEVEVFPTGDELFEAFQKKPCDLAVLDIMMPGTDGLTVCKNLRAISKVPIIILTAKDSEMDYVTGMTYGGDDYLMKPFRPSMLVMRIKALFRRIEMEHETKPAEDTAAFGDLTYFAKTREIRCAGKTVPLTMTELALLRYMLEQSDRAIPREELLDEVWGITADIETRVTDETVRRIRKKLTAAGSRVSVTVVWGYGYKLEEKA